MKKINILLLIVFGLQIQSCMLDLSQFNSGMGNLIRLLGLTEAVGNRQDLVDLSGTLLDENGNPIANATLNVSQNTSTTIRAIATSTTKTDSEGKYNLQLKIGIFNIQVTNSTGASLGNLLITATSLNTTPTITVSSGNFIVTISAFNSGTSSAPSGLRYIGTPYIFQKDYAITTQKPTYTGNITSCSSVPSLPTGLSLSNTCEITGTPTLVQTAKPYHITATNLYGNSSVVILITINLSAPSALSYSRSPYILLQGLSISSQTPTYSGSVTSCSVSPALPTGLSLNTTTCVLSGTPSNIQNSTNYTITATNSIGSTTASISISIQSPNNYIVSMPTGLLKTGQTTSYTTGDDGTYQKGASRTFTTGGTNGLIWQRCSAGQNNDSTCSGTAQTYTWDQANNYCSTLSLGGRSWRLPTVNELANLLDHSKLTGFIIDSNIFPNTTSASTLYFWSSTLYALNSNNIWRVNFSPGGLEGASYTSIGNQFYVRCTTGVSSSQSILTDNGNGTITDSATGLIWQKCISGLGGENCSTGNINNYTWTNALWYCEDLILGGRTDWRLSNLNELRSIIDYTKLSSPTINSTAFPNTQHNNSYYLSSTSFSQSSNCAWYVHFIDGTVAYYCTKTAFFYVRCVAGP